MKTFNKKTKLIGSVLAAATLQFAASGSALAISTSKCTSYDYFNSTNTKVPYRHADFDSVIANSKSLQWPKSTHTCLSDTQLNTSSGKGAFVNHRFFQENGVLIFDFKETGYRDYNNASNTDRMELRGKDFSTSGTGTKSWSAHVRLPNRNDSDHSTQVAIGQLFATDDVAKIQWYKSKTKNGTNYQDYFWLSVDENGSASGGTQYYPIGAASDSFKYIRLRLDKGNDTVEVKYGGTVKHVKDVSAWGNVTMYHKAGCYLQADGKCRVEFDSLSY